MEKARRFAFLAAFLLAGTAPRAAFGYIEKLYSLKEVLDECTNVLSGKLETIDRGKGVAVAVIEAPLKGAIEYERIQMNLGLGPADHTKYLLEQWSEGDPFVLFYSRSGDSIASIAYAGDTWFQLFATHGRSWKDVWWRFTHLEIYMGRTFDGKTEDLARITKDVLEGRMAPPPPDPRVPKLDLRRPRSRARPVRGGDGARVAVLAERGGVWRYAKGVAEPSGGQAAWREAAYEDSRWASGSAPFGYGDKPFGTEMPDMQRATENAGYSTLFLRRRFEVADPAAIEKLELHVDYDDGFIAWINGRPAAERNAPAGDRGHGATAPGDHESGSYEVFEVSDCRKSLVRGANSLAVQVFNRDLTSSDLKLDAELGAVIRTDAGNRGRFRRLYELDLPESPEARGIAWADANGDGKPDVCFARRSGNVLLLGKEDGFSPAAEGSLGAARSAAWADPDADGDLDLLTSDFKLFLNTGGRFKPSDLPPPEGGRNSEGAGWLDYDGDGLPDVLITNGEYGILLYRNAGSDPGRFRDVSKEAGLGQGGAGSGNGDFVAFADVDADGYTDFLYNLAGGLLARNRRNGSFRVSTETRIAMQGGSAWKRGVAFADLDNDGDMDFHVPGPEGPGLHLNANDGTWQAKHVADPEQRSPPSFSSAWGDVDCDGSLDLFVCHPNETGRLHAGNGSGSFADITREVGLEGIGPALAAAFADADGDGDLDLALHLERKILILANDLKRKPGRAGLEVKLAVRKGRTGSVVRALERGGKLLGLRELNGGEGCGGQAAQTAHFGLPRGPVRITVCLSDGRFAAKTVNVEGEKAAVVLRDEDFVP